MVLVDTSVWVAQLQHGTTGLEALLQEGEDVCHRFIVGKLACGNLKNRTEILFLLQALRQAIPAKHEAVMHCLSKISA